MRDRSRHHPAPLPNGCGPFPSSLAPVAGIEPAVLPALTRGAPRREVVGIAPTHGNTGGPRAARSRSGRPLTFVARVNKGLTPARGTGGVRSTSPHKAFRPVRLSSSHTAAHAEGGVGRRAIELIGASNAHRNTDKPLARGPARPPPTP